MAHTYTQVLIHAIFSTRQRQPRVTGEIQAELFPYLAGSISRMKGKPVLVNGPRDYVHILFSLPPVWSLSDAMEKLKANSSRWLHQRWPRQHGFARQTGYAAFSVSQSNLASIRNYIARQEERRRKMTYQEPGSHGWCFPNRGLFVGPCKPAHGQNSADRDVMKWRCLLGSR